MMKAMKEKYVKRWFRTDTEYTRQRMLLIDELAR